MSKTREWIIGADPGCDIVVDAPSVSSRHCRLLRNAQGFSVEDLESTNGTWIDGVRCTARKQVSRTDTITLGQTEPMPWPKKKSPGTARTIAIGRLPENDVVLDDPMVSGRHAEITIKDGRATIKDLDSRNGTSIGSVDQKIQTSPITARDTVFFGTSAFRAADFLEPGGNVQPVEATIPVTALPRLLIDVGESGSSLSRLRKSRWFVPAVIGGPALLVTAIISAIVANSGKGTPSEKTKSDRTPTTSTTPTTSVPVDPQATLYWILVKDMQEARTFRVGTAVAIGKRHLLTSASLIKAISTLQADFPEVAVLCPATEKQFRVDFEKSRLHPQFETAYQASKEANDRYEHAAEKMEKFKQDEGKPQGDPSSDDAKKRRTDLRNQFTALGKQLTKWNSEVLTNSEQATCFDLGVLELAVGERPLPGHLIVSAKNVKHQSGEAIVFWGNPFPAEEPLLTSYSGHRSKKLTGRIRMLQRVDAQIADPYRLVIKSEKNLAGSQWAGAVVLDGDHRIIGVFSRLRPSYTGKHPPGDLFDVPLASRLRDFFPIGKSLSQPK